MKPRKQIIEEAMQAKKPTQFIIWTDNTEALKNGKILTDDEVEQYAGRAVIFRIRNGSQAVLLNEMKISYFYSGDKKLQTGGSKLIDLLEFTEPNNKRKINGNEKR